MKLRWYQEPVIEGIRNCFSEGKRRVIMCAPTGAGKSAKFSYMVKRHISKGGKALIITDRKELQKQSKNTFEMFGINPELIQSGKQPDLSMNLHVSMSETLYRRCRKYSEFLNTRTLVVIDEAHKTFADKIFPYLNEEAFVIGATATPYRKGKSQSSLSDFYQDIVYSIDTNGLIEAGFLSKPNYFGVEVDLSGVGKIGGEYSSSQLEKRYAKLKTFKGVIDNYKRLAEGKKTIVFCSGVSNSIELRNEFISKGYKAEHLDSDTPTNERDRILDWFDKTKNGILCNCNILNTGFDQVDIECVVLYRATTSLPLYLQMVGRGGRVTPTKKEFTILDFGNNVGRFGFWDEPREWSLEKVQSGSEQPAPIKNCPKCEAILPASATECSFCGHKFEKKEEEVLEVELKELESKVPVHLRGKKLSELDLTELGDLQQSKAYKHTFIWRIVRSKGKDAVMDYAHEMGYGSGWAYRQMREMGNSSYSDYTLR